MKRIGMWLSQNAVYILPGAGLFAYQDDHDYDAPYVNEPLWLRLFALYHVVGMIFSVFGLVKIMHEIKYYL